MIGMSVCKENGIEGARIKVVLGERAAARLARIHQNLVATGSEQVRSMSSPRAWIARRRSKNEKFCHNSILNGHREESPEWRTALEPG
jgi:hypothetical protein